MARTLASRHPMEWTVEALRRANARAAPVAVSTAPVRVRRIDMTDLVVSLREGFADFTAGRTDAILLCVMYPVAGLVLSHLAMGRQVMPLVFPLVAGFALLGPLLATGLYQMSRQRERTGHADWADAFTAFASPAIISIMLLGVALLAMFMLWLIAATIIYNATLGPLPPVSLSAFVGDLLTTPAGWAMGVFGVGVGGAFAAAVLACSVVSFPLLLDRNVSPVAAIDASLRATRLNAAPVAAWGAIVAGLLVAGSLPFLIGLAVVLPVLGHATWHLYRKLVYPN